MIKITKFLIAFVFIISFYTVGCSKNPDYIVLGEPEISVEIEKQALNKYRLKVVDVNDKRFGPMPMIMSGPVPSLKINGHSIELVDGKVKNGLLMTKNYGAVKIFGIHPMYLWVLPEQKQKLIQLANK